MSPLDLIPPQYRIAAELALAAAALIAAGVCGAMVMHWHDGAQIAELKAQHAQAIAAATAKTLAAQQKADADHSALAGQLAQSSATHLESLQRSERENSALRADVAAGTRVVRIAASCPTGAAGVPETAASGRLDSPAGAVLDPATGQTVLDLRAAITRTESKLAACQDAARALTGQK